jgi:hypothetical protein
MIDLALRECIWVVSVDNLLCPESSKTCGKVADTQFNVGGFMEVLEAELERINETQASIAPASPERSRTYEA